MRGASEIPSNLTLTLNLVRTPALTLALTRTLTRPDLYPCPNPTSKPNSNPDPIPDPIPGPRCEGRPSFTGAVAQTIKASEHSAAERALAFAECIVKSLTDPSYTFGFVKLSELLHDLCAMRRGQEAPDTSVKSSFKELLHVVAMRLKRPTWQKPDGSVDPAYANSDEQPNWREPTRFLRYETAPDTTPIGSAAGGISEGEDGEDLGRSEHGTPLERASVSFVQLDGEPTFVGAPAAGRKAAEQAAAEAALAFIFDRTLAE